MIYRTHITRHFFGPCVFLILVGGLSAEPLQGQELALNLQECVSAAMERNPLIRSARSANQLRVAEKLGRAAWRERGEAVV